MKSNLLRACFKIPWGPVFEEKAEWRGATKENIPSGSSTEEQRSQAAFSAKTLRAAALLSAACVGSALTARRGDARSSPPWPQPKSLAAGLHAILKQALRHPFFARFKQVLLLAIAGVVCILAAENPVGEKEKIEALILRIENLKDAVFVRNGSNYDSKTAAKFLRGKWEKHTKEIKNATEFIEKLASNSSTSGKPYVIQFKGGRETKCGDYLKAELKILEQSQGKKPTTQ